ncbi:uncharacterized protein JCM6883_007424 [Sporobolomyces salmoneus]|uniref:uncharacterized protein n=1 Tax=Sporobolomyces salmoneus TaxID=183962 RepID=UPI00318167DB
MISIEHLPPEIVQLIVEGVEDITAWERTNRREYGTNLPGGDWRRRRRERERRHRHGEDSEDDEEELTAGEAMMAMFGGLIGGLPVGRGAGAGGGAQGPANAPNGTTGNTPARPATQPNGAQAAASTTSRPAATTGAAGNGSNANTNARESSASGPSATATRPLGASLGPQPSTSTSARPSATTAPSAASNSRPEAREQAPSSDSDSDVMPPLESILKPSASTSASTSTSKGKAPETAPQNDSDSDSMPALETVAKPAQPSTPAPAPAPAKPQASTSKSGFGASFASNLRGAFASQPKKQAAPTQAPAAKKNEVGSSSGPIPTSNSTSSKGKAPASSAPVKKPAVTIKDEDEDSDDMPPLESVLKPSPTANSKGKSPALPPGPSSPPSIKKPRTKTPEERDSGVEKISPLARLPVVPSSSSTSSSQARNPSVTIKDDDSDSDDSMPPLETISTAPSNPPSTTLQNPPTLPIAAQSSTINGDSDNEMPPLERIDGGGGGGDPSDDEDDSDDDDDDYDSDWRDTDQDEESSEGNEYDVSSIASEDCTFADGLPLDPLLPLMYISRPFLHAARKTLYKRLHIQTAFQARLLLDSLTSVEHAARTEDEELVTESSDEGEEAGEPDRVRKGGKNALAKMIKTLRLEAQNVARMGRGGGRVYIELLERCRKLEHLTIKPVFTRSATEPLLAALNNLPKLRSLDISSSTCRKYPFVFTTPRVFQIQQSCPELEDLTVQYLKGADEGDYYEEDKMYEIIDQEEESGELEDGKKKQAVKRKGLKILELYDFDVSSDDISTILRDSKKTLTALKLCNPREAFTRRSFADVMLNFGHRLTSLDVSLPASWWPQAEFTAGDKNAPVPAKPKGYVQGKPSHDHVMKIARHYYILDAVTPYLPNLKVLGWTGPQASSRIFSLMPPSVSTVSYGRCTSVQPKTVARLLNKVTNRTITVTQPDGSKTTKTVKSKYARGLTCLTVSHDDLSWSEEEIQAMEIATGHRDCCLHLSSSGDGPGLGGMGLFGGGGGGGLGPIGFPIPLGALGGGGGGP